MQVKFNSVTGQKEYKVEISSGPLMYMISFTNENFEVVCSPTDPSLCL